MTHYQFSKRYHITRVSFLTILKGQALWWQGSICLWPFFTLWSRNQVKGKSFIKWKEYHQKVRYNTLKEPTITAIKNVLQRPSMVLFVSECRRKGLPFCFCLIGWNFHRVRYFIFKYKNKRFEATRWCISVRSYFLFVNLDTSKDQVSVINKLEDTWKGMLLLKIRNTQQIVMQDV